VRLAVELEHYRASLLNPATTWLDHLSLPQLRYSSEPVQKSSAEPYHSLLFMTLTNYRRLLPASLRLVVASSMEHGSIARLDDMRAREFELVTSFISGMSSASWQTATKG
jgi:hypothetical protein